MAASGKKNARKNAAAPRAGRGAGASEAAPRGLRANRERAAEPEAAAPLLDEGSGRDIAGVVLAIVAVASFIAVIAPSTAPVTSAVAGFYHLGFGLGAYVLPLCLLAVAALLFLRGSVPLSARSCAGVGLIFLSVVAILSLSVPGTEASTALMFEPENLSSSGGYLGAFIASTLQGALGKTISYVVLVGLIVLGFVIIGVSVSGLARGVYERAERLAARRRVDVNESPWGDDLAAAPARAGRGGAVPFAAPAAPRQAQASLFDDSGAAETTYLGSRETTVLDDDPDEDEDPFVDLSAQVEAEQAKTTLLDGRGRGGDAGSDGASGAAKVAQAARHAAQAVAGARTARAGRPAHAAAAPADAAGTAPTTLIPVKERFAADLSEVDPIPAAGAAPVAAAVAGGRALDVISDARASLGAASAPGDAAPHASDGAMEPRDVLPWDEPADEAYLPAAGTPAAPAAQPVPEFLRKQASAARTASGADRPSDAETSSAPKLVQEVKPKPIPKPKPLAGGTAAPATSVDDPQDERKLPPVSMLRHNPASAQSASSNRELEQTAEGLQSTLQEFGLHSRVVGWIAGPTVTTFKVQPGEGERVSRITNLEDDIALSLATDSVRIFAPIPGTSLVGIEIPNRTRQTVAFGDILPYVTGGPLEFALGRDAEGQPMVADLAKMPHLLIAGTTGSGKSVVISSILMSLLMRTFPEDVRLIMIDPKRVEFAPYDGLPHLYVPVVTEPKQAASALQWAVSEMERRLKVFERIGVRKISTFNEKQAAGEFEKYDNPPAKMPYLVIVIDELSDLMMVAGKDVEASIVRIAQLGRAAGIHMIVATQRPSSNVVTGLIKANITNRIGLTVATGIDSRVILDQTGAEKLIGQGDMLFSRVDWGKPKRIQGCYVSDEEIFSVVAFVKEQSPAEYHTEILSAVAPAMVGGGGGGSHEPADDDPLIWEAARIVVESQLGSTSGLQRRLKVGYARAGRIMDMLEEKGVVGPPDGSKPREVLLDAEGLAELEAVEARMADEDEFGGF